MRYNNTRKILRDTEISAETIINYSLNRCFLKRMNESTVQRTVTAQLLSDHEINDLLEMK